MVRAAPDGYTLLSVSSPNAINASLYKNLNFNFIRDIAPVGSIMRVPLVMEVNPSVPVKTVPELIAYIKANPGKISYASAGIGTPQHVSAELFKMMTGVEMVQVPYRGAAPALTDLIGGQVQVMIDTTPASMQHIRSGKVRALAVTTATRAAVLPDLPTVADFLPGYEATSWFGIGVAEEHAARNHRKAQQGNQRRARRSQGQRAVERPRRHTYSRHARRVRPTHRARNREVGQGDRILRRQSELKRRAESGKAAKSCGRPTP